MGRVGILRTKSGEFQTPHMFPVVDPNRHLFEQKFFNELGIHAIMTNAYLLRRTGLGQGMPENIHRVLGFSETVATDSGAYQILRYGKVAVKPEEIVRYQEEIDADIGVILDVPTGYRSDVTRARWTVDETIRRADGALRVRNRNDILWVGPVQGGIYLKEVTRSAREMAKRDFDIYALGSPTELMESQRFEILVDMILAARREIPPSKPLHLFGAGHPALFPFLVALGCDLFDSAAYALYARTDRYFTSEGTSKLREMEEFPCLCPACSDKTPSEMVRMEPGEREKLLSHHNLQASFSELRKIREAIRKGRLWDLLELRAHTHPALKNCLRRIEEYSEELERWTPVVKPRGIFYYGGSSDRRPEITRYRMRLEKTRLPRRRVVILLPGRWRRPYHEDPRYRFIVSHFQNNPAVQLVFYTVPFGPVPLELDETYPLAQTESADPREPALYRVKAQLVTGFLRRLSPQLVFFVRQGELGTFVKEELSSRLAKSKLVTINGEGFKLQSFVRTFERRVK
jgi:7-cyano-7-deazaguanine tRNA-ribosyltransferase